MTEHSSERPTATFIRPENLRELALPQLIERYREQHRQAEARLRQLVDLRNQRGAGLRSALEAFRQQQHLPQLDIQQQQDDEIMIDIFSAGDPALDPIRDAIMARLNADAAQGTPEQRSNVFLNGFEELRRAGAADVMIIDRLLQQRINESSQRVIDMAKTSGAVQTAFEAIRQNRPLPELQGAPTPQESVFGVFLFNALSNNNPPELVTALAQHQNRTVDWFVENTFETFRTYLTSQNISLDQFCPDRAWYRNLCMRAGIEARLNNLNLGEFLPTQNLLTFNGDMNARIESVRREYEEALRSGNTERARELNRVITGYSDVQGRINGNITLFGMSQGIQPVGRESPTLSDAVDDPRRFALDVTNRPIEWTSRAMDWFSGLVPDPTRFRDLDFWGILRTLGKVTAATAVAINVGAFGFQQLRRLREVVMLRQGPIAAVQEAFKDLWGTLPTTVLTTGVLGAFIATDSEQNMQWVRDRWQDVTTGVRRVAGTDIFAGAASRLRGAISWIQENGGNRAMESASGAARFLYDKAGDILSWTGDQASNGWEALGILCDRVGISAREYREHLETMGSLQQEANNHFHTQNLEINARTISVSSSDFNTFLLEFIQNNRDERTAQRRPIDYPRLRSMGFINADDVLRAQGKPPFTPSAALAQRLVRQGLWWERNQAAMTQPVNA